MEERGRDGEGGVPNQFILHPEARRLVLAALFGGPGARYVQREGNVISVDFHLLPVQYRQVLKACREEPVKRLPFNLDCHPAP